MLFSMTLNYYVLILYLTLLNYDFLMYIDRHIVNLQCVSKKHPGHF